MKAMKLVEFGKPLQMVESELLPLLDDNVLVKVEACGVCHSGKILGALGGWEI
jgi:D-arabinose 1-dehydrogenase-like Zn-dependent alcohol dehydrogenase